MKTKLKQLFALGDVVATPAAMNKVDPRYALSCLELHHSGDWGLVDEEDWKTNDNALKTGGRLLSSYPLPDDADMFWIITEAEDENGRRVATTFLLPSDY